ncbi:hypothetical protein LCGC14_1430590, partial [marine sediment metagenome]
IRILFNITNVLGYNGTYEYYIIADFDDPSPTITVGDGTENFEDGTIADPSTSISFNSNEIITSGSQRYSWEDYFTFFDSSYMSHNYYPDDYSNTWTMDPLNMYNAFPSSITTKELWDNWNLNYDPSQTTTSFNNGSLSSQIIDGYNVFRTSSIQPENTHLWWETDNHETIYAVDSADNTRLWKTTDKGANWNLITTRSKNIARAYPDRTNGIIYFVDCEYDGTTSYVWSLTLSDDSITEVDSIPDDVYDVFLIGNDVHVSYAVPTYVVETGIIRPDGDGSPLEWTNTGGGYHFEDVNDAIVQPSTSNPDGNRIQTTSQTYPAEEEEFQMTTIDISGYDSGIVREITVWVYTYRGVRTELYIKGNKPGTTSYVYTPSPLAVWDWASATFSGLSLSQADLTDFEVTLLHSPYGVASGHNRIINVLYAEVKFEGDVDDTKDDANISIKNLTDETSVSQYIGTRTGRSYDIGQVVVVGTDAYFLLKWSDENVELWKYDSSGGTIAQQLNVQTDFGPNANLPPVNQRGLSYDENNIISFVLDFGPNANYYHTYSISGDAFTRGSEYDIVLPLNRNTASGAMEKAFGVFEYKVYYIDIGGILTMLDTPNLDASIIAITENFLMTSNGKLYERLESFADITKTINDDFLNRYDLGYPNYKKLTDITTEFDYRFVIDNINFNDFAEFTIDGNKFSLTKDGQWHPFSEVIEFDSTLKDSFDVMFNISNGFLELDNMEYEYNFKLLDINDHILLQQDFEIDFNEEEMLLPLRNFRNIEFLIYNSYTFTSGTDGNIYYNTYGRTDKLEIIYKIKANGQWYSSIYSTNLADSGIKYFNVSQFMLDNRLTIFQDFAVEYIIIGNNSNLTVNSISLNCSTYQRQLQEFYRIIDNEIGTVSEWILFNSSANTITILDDFGELPGNFTIEYKVIDRADNVGINPTYNGVYDYIIYSEEKPVTLSDDNIDLNSVDFDERKLSFTADFGGIINLDAYINGFLYGTQAVNIGGNDYELSFGTNNDYETLIGYSQSLISPSIYSNINPLNRISWEVEKDDYFAAVKHVLVDEDIVIINPITYNATANLDLEHLYDRGFGLLDYARFREAYYYNETTGEKIALTRDLDFTINERGNIQFPEYSVLHDLYNYISDVQGGIVRFDYAASDIYDQLMLYNADGFYINFAMPAVYYDHTTVEKLIISFHDAEGQTFSKIYYDLDFREYFLDAVKAQYETNIFGLGEMMEIPLYIDINEIDLPNPNVQFDLKMLESITFTISDSERWPGSFIQDFEDYSVMNLPYQRVGILDLKLYNLISDSIEVDDDDYVSSEVVFKAPDYYNYYAKSTFKIKRLDIEFTDLKVYSYNEEIFDGSTVDIEYSDYIELNY